MFLFQSGECSCFVSFLIQTRLTQVWWVMTNCSRQPTERASSASLSIGFWCRRCCRSSWFLCSSRLSPWTKDSMEKVGGLYPETVQRCLNTLNLFQITMQYLGKSVQVAVLKCVLFLYFYILLHLSCLPVSEVECWADYNKRIIPIVIGAVVVGLILIAGLIYLFIRDNRRQGYESLWELRSSNNSEIDEKLFDYYKSLKVLFYPITFYMIPVFLLTAFCRWLLERALI